MPRKLREECANDPYYQVCARSNEECEGRITWEHALTYKGSQIQEKFAVIPLCEYHHLGAGLYKKTNEWIAVGRATHADKMRHDRFPWSKYQ
jgi:hypothetical protein